MRRWAWTTRPALAIGIYPSIFNLFIAILRTFGFLSSDDE